MNRNHGIVAVLGLDDVQLDDEGFIIGRIFCFLLTQPDPPTVLFCLGNV